MLLYVLSDCVRSAHATYEYERYGIVNSNTYYFSSIYLILNSSCTFCVYNTAAAAAMAAFVVDIVIFFLSLSLSWLLMLCLYTFILRVQMANKKRKTKPRESESEGEKNKINQTIVEQLHMKMNAAAESSTSLG